MQRVPTCFDKLQRNLRIEIRKVLFSCHARLELETEPVILIFHSGDFPDHFTCFVRLHDVTGCAVPHVLFIINFTSR